MAKIETLLLANHAEAVNGLLYLSGGGWNEIYRAPAPPGVPPAPNHFGIAITVSVPWTETNVPHRLIVTLVGEDGGPEMLKIEGGLEVGRPPGLPPGSEQRAAIALDANVVFPSTGGYVLRAEIDEDIRHVSFRVRDRAPVTSC